MTKEDILGYATNNGETLSQPNVYLGGWLDEGIGYLDISTNVRNLQEAIELAMASDQLAIWDIVKGESIYLDDIKTERNKKT